MPEEGVELTEKSDLMTIEEVLELAKTFVKMGVKKIRLTGGEPLIRKNIEHLLLELGKLPVELAITTNGVLVDKYIDVFEKIGLKSINISLDSLDKEKSLFITKRDYFDRIMNNIQLLLDRNFKVKANVVLIRGVNDNELIDFVEWTKDKDLSLRFIEFMPFSGNNWDWDKGISLAETLETVKEYYHSDNILRLTDLKNDTSLNYKIKGYKGSFAIISSVTNPFCGTCNRVRITSNGTMKNCLFSNNEVDLLTPIRKEYNIENLIRNSIYNKKFERAGMDSFEKFSDSTLNSNNRSMTTIGG